MFEYDIVSHGDEGIKVKVRLSFSAKDPDTATKILKKIELLVSKGEIQKTESVIACEHCKKCFKRINGLTSHKKHCNLKPMVVEDTDEVKNPQKGE